MPSHTFHDCCNAIIRAADGKPQAANIQFAASYSRQGLRMPDAASNAECADETRVQISYILVNLSGWRGEEARAVRRSLKAIGGIK